MPTLLSDKHDILTCPMCEASFTCFCNRPAACPCVQANVTRDEAEWISWQTGGECVCIACLMRLREEARQVLT
ncbi:Cysteine-rich CWC [Prosthecobacter debontii]|uniref:Cysteine-rich CWC n=1 Tax=Prosthecobacter debontii TaxID=48467 RepID=A0A1T4Z2G5_9BACT|nr:cysteine-rich CWC family protein [Prosthecobacter debontii]SKB08237.1 Cysteine-rich CWC [Prosthecobacter debontii]